MKPLDFWVSELQILQAVEFVLGELSDWGFHNVEVSDRGQGAVEKSNQLCVVDQFHGFQIFGGVDELHQLGVVDHEFFEFDVLF